MKAIFKRDFLSFYKSPVGYIFSAVMITMFYLTFYYANILLNSGDVGSLFTTISFMIALVIPILTMKLISEEYSKKTDQLLLTAPVGVLDIVMGKFLAVMASFAVTVAGTLLIPIILAINGAADLWSLIGNYLATFFTAAAFIAIGMFISSLTENVFISAIISWSTFIGLFIVDLLISLADNKIANSLHMFSIYSRSDNIRIGILNITDFIYYISVAAIFIFLTSRVLEKKRYS